MEEKELDDKLPMMKALVFHGVGKWPTLEQVPRPTIQEPTDIIIRVHKTTICGTDLHILSGNVPTASVGRVLGHEGMGHVVAVGEAVEKWKIGDRGLTSCITACGKCDACQKYLYAFCTAGGWQLGNTRDGMQAEYTRITRRMLCRHLFPCVLVMRTIHTSWRGTFCRRAGKSVS